MCGDPVPDPFSCQANSVEVKVKNNRNHVKVEILFDHLTFDKARQVAYARGFPSVASLFKSYIEEWIEYDLSYVEED